MLETHPAHGARSDGEGTRLKFKLFGVIMPDPVRAAKNSRIDKWAENPPIAVSAPIRKLSIAEQTAEHVREGIRSGRWRGELPGVLLLAKACDVSKDAMRDALRLLETEGLISPGHAGTHRTVMAIATPTPRRAMRVAIFPHEPLADGEPRDV